VVPNRTRQRDWRAGCAQLTVQTGSNDINEHSLDCSKEKVALVYRFPRPCNSYFHLRYKSAAIYLWPAVPQKPKDSESTLTEQWAGYNSFRLRSPFVGTLPTPSRTLILALCCRTRAPQAHSPVAHRKIAPTTRTVFIAVVHVTVLTPEQAWTPRNNVTEGTNNRVALPEGSQFEVRKESPILCPVAFGGVCFSCSVGVRNPHNY